MYFNELSTCNLQRTIEEGTVRSEILDLQMGAIPEQVPNKKKPRDLATLVMKLLVFCKLWKSETLANSRSSWYYMA